MTRPKRKVGARAGSAGASQGWRNRIVGHGEEPPEQLLANPFNFRLHPQPQQAALGGSLEELGWLQSVIVNRTTGHVIDGHLRIELAISKEDPAVPVTYVELTEDEERMALAVFDRIGSLAAINRDGMLELIGTLSCENDALMQVLRDMANEGAERPHGDDGDGGQVEEDQEQRVCPACGFQW